MAEMFEDRIKLSGEEMMYVFLIFYCEQKDWKNLYDTQIK
jgi:hypothetical protein